ncbi:hypothetical protein D9M72_625610 [compost metagenome]
MICKVGARQAGDVSQIAGHQGQHAWRQKGDESCQDSDGNCEDQRSVLDNLGKLVALGRKHHGAGQYGVDHNDSVRAVLIRALSVGLSATPKIRAETLPCLSSTKVVGTALSGTYFVMAS